MKNKRKILFLDIDGVLNCHDTMSYWSPKHPEMYRIDPDCWTYLERFLDDNRDVEVVIHSGWIKWKDEPDYKWDMGTGNPDIWVKSLIPEVAKRLGNRLVGYVPYVKNGSKFHRIVMWLNNNGYDLIHIENENITVAVLDDEDNGWTNLRQLRNFPCIYVRFTDPRVGLQPGDIEYLNTVFNL